MTKTTDEDRSWNLYEEGYFYDTVMASTSEEALTIAVENVDRANYSDVTGTLYIDVRAYCESTDEEVSSTVTLEPEEPECADGNSHEWESPYELLGGIKENPGVWGHGGGVIIRECCCYCGTYRVIDTWAQRRDTGEQGLREVRYEDADDASKEWISNG